MPTDYSKIQFSKIFPFESIVTTFGASIIAIEGFFDDSLFKVKDDDFLGVVGRKYRARVNISKLRQYSKEHFDKSWFSISLTISLINRSWYMVEKFQDYSPEFEFFRHLRNAASHGNRFKFNKIEPSRPASWRGITIDHNLKGSSNPLQNKMCITNKIASADIILLLWDIEHRITSESPDIAF